MNTESLDLAVYPIFHRMHTRGLKVDLTRVHSLIDEVEALRADCLTWFTWEVGPDFNPGSADQVAAWMEAEHLPIHKRTRKKRRAATDEKTLAGYTAPVLRKIIEYRGYQKLLGTFLWPLVGYAADDGIVHPRWKLTRVRSGRPAAEDPNLLAFPVRDALGRKVRDCFVARPGMKMVSVDYSQIEPRLVAALSEDTKLVEIYRTGRDIYKETARALFHIPEGSPVDDFRHRLPAKTVTLGVLYGMGPQKLYESLLAAGCGEGDPWVPYFDLDACGSLIDRWFDIYPGVRRLVTRTVLAARQADGWVYTVGGRGRYLPGLFLTGRYWPHSKLREEAERQVFNTLIQGTAAERMKEGMIEVDGAHLPFEPLLQIYDELVGEAPENVAEDTASIMRGLMEVEFMGIELVTKAAVAGSWGQLK
jgi:DNA polymerase I